MAEQEIHRIHDGDEYRNVVVDWLALLLPVRESPGSFLGPKPAVLIEVIRGFPHSTYV
jgi:hypothetical protein